MIKTFLRRRKPAFKLNPRSLGMKVQNEIETQELDVATVAERIGVSTRKLNKIMLGKYEVSLELAVNLSEELKIDVDALIFLKGTF